jgi:ribosomal protein S18 acetylase RimI-like enzyme
VREVLAWLEETARRRSTSVRTVPGGFVVRNRDYPDAHDHNRLFITAPVDADELAAAADRELADAAHRLIYIHDLEVAGLVGPRLVELGYERNDELVLVAQPPPPRREVEVVELDLDERIAVATADWRTEQSPDVARQLGERIRTVGAAAETTFLAVRSADGAVAAHVDLYIRDGYAQIEELMTTPAARGRGFGSALVVDAMHRAGDNRTFIVADLDEWPKQMYRRLGFVDLGVIAALSRS